MSLDGRARRRRTGIRNALGVSDVPDVARPCLVTSWREAGISGRTGQQLLCRPAGRVRGADLRGNRTMPECDGVGRHAAKATQAQKPGQDRWPRVRGDVDCVASVM